MSKYSQHERRPDTQPAGDLQWLEDGFHDVMGAAWAAVRNIFSCVIALFKNY